MDKELEEILKVLTLIHKELYKLRKVLERGIYIEESY